MQYSGHSKTPLYSNLLGISGFWNIASVVKISDRICPELKRHLFHGVRGGRRFQFVPGPQADRVGQSVMPVSGANALKALVP